MSFYYIDFNHKGDWTKSLKRYFSQGGNPNQREPTSGWTLLHYAVENGNLEAINCLVNNGADLDIQDHNGWTPLHLAVDADIDCLIQNNEKALALPTVNLLLELGADPTIINMDGETPRDIAAQYGEKALTLYSSLIKK